MLRIGLTGGIASGKSSVATWLRARGVPVLDADRLARAAMAPTGPAYAKVVGLFGPSYVLPDGQIDRRRLGELVFRDEAARRRLEAVVHPPVLAGLAGQAARWRWRGARLVVLDIPLLYEVGEPALRLVDRVCVVYVDPATQLRRLMARDGLDEAAARARLAAQLPLEWKARRADDVVDNSGSWSETERQLEILWQRWQALATQRARQVGG